MMKSQNGLTLVELLITIVVLTTLLALGVPSFKEFIKNNRLTAQANSLVMAMQVARNEAIKRGTGSMVCASADQLTCSGNTDWATGWIVFSDLDQEGDLDGNGVCATENDSNTKDCILSTSDSLAGNNTMTANANQIQYLPNGMAQDIPDDPDDATIKRVVFDLTADACYKNQVRRINVSQQGHTHIETRPCP